MLDKYLPRIEFDSYEDFKANYTVNIPDDFNFGYDVVDGWAAADPDKPALVWCDDCGGERSFTFGDISAQSNRAANMLRKLGVSKGDAVMLILRRRFEYWFVVTALHKLGAVAIPASLQLTSKDIDYRVQAAGIKTLICVDDGFVLEQVRQSAFDGVKIIVNGERDGWLSLDRELEGMPDTLERVPTKSDDLMLMYFTSGTTGMPKMVRHTFEHPLGHIVTAKYWQRVQNGRLHMSVSDSGWAKFGWGKIYGQWLCGAVIFAYDMDKFVPKLLLEKLERYKVTTFCAPPTMYRFMLQEDLTRYDLSGITHCCNAGEPLNPEVYRQFRELTGLRLTEGFGQSESSVMLANFEWFEPRPGSMGKPSPLYDIDLVGADGKTCPAGVEGEIVIRGFGDEAHPCGLFYGYHNDPAYNARVISGGVYYTGDVAWRDDDGYYWFVGRNDDVIKCSGYRIGPFEVESALVEHPDVVECAVTAAPDPVRGQVVKASVILRAGVTGTPELVKELQNHVKKLTAPYKYPRIIEFVTELPKTVSGKIKRKQIREADECAAPPPPAAPPAEGVK
ncbi:MAG: AMP-binding protein [Oscillospiraceae bacterium]|nr:AMP-binding protein [Oscillospiraceae bacterium]